jgi:hypothetical protein
MSETQGDETNSSSYRQMTVAQIREQNKADHVEVVFLESARFHKLFRTNPQYVALLERLRNALENSRSLQVRLMSPNGDIIEDVREPG